MSTTAEARSAGPEIAVSSAADPVLVQGRRAFFTYRDLGVTKGSQGRIRAQVTVGKDGMTEPTGWHVHLCEGQFVYLLSGWIDLEFADRKVRLQAGDSVFIPGNTPHNETGASRDFELLEVSVPADMGTRPCDPPAGRG
ncbi:MAG: cupin domain-containing protein [Rhodospirillales bacterium]|jgi:mannose-6-phosphate isomerase-like protein (cupin superfamily)|nr:cupin domain-containing protein [Rhodospirillales bacterium]